MASYNSILPLYINSSVTTGVDSTADVVRKILYSKEFCVPSDTTFTHCKWMVGLRRLLQQPSITMNRAYFAKVDMRVG